MQRSLSPALQGCLSMVLLGLVTGPASAQCPEWDARYSLPGLDGDAAALIVHDDGGGPALFVGGGFTGAGPATASNVARWDGSSWSAVGAGTNGAVRALAVFDDGGGPALYAGGLFSSAGGFSARRVARWDGLAWSPLASGIGPGPNDQVLALASFDDGGGPALYAGGIFSSVDGGLPASRVARWDGTTWSAVGAGLPGTVTAFAVFDDGGGPALYATSNLFPAARVVVRWDGVSWTTVGAAFDDSIASLAVHDDGGGARLYAGGRFSQVGAVAAQGVVLWDGNAWQAVGGGPSGDVFELLSFDDGGGAALYAAGALGSNSPGVERWNGVAWTALDPGTLPPNASSGGGQALATFDGGSGPELFVGGSFWVAGSSGATRVARWTGTSWARLGDGEGLVTGEPVTLEVVDLFGGPALYAAGIFLSIGGVAATSVARWDGSAWSPLGSGPINHSTGRRSLCVFDDGGGPALYVSGGELERWDGTSWTPIGVQSLGEKDPLIVFDDGGGPQLYLGGGDIRMGATTLLGRIARWDGTTWETVGGGVNSEVLALAVYDDGGGPDLYAAGKFDVAGAVQALHVARFDGTTWSALGPGPVPGTDAMVRALEVYDDGGGPALYAGGHFTVAGSETVDFIARWDGSSWSALPGGGTDGAVRSLHVFDDGGGSRLVVGGQFSNAGGAPASKIALWDGASWSALGSGTNLRVETIHAFADGLQDRPALYFGGRFDIAGGLPSEKFARWADACCNGFPTVYCVGETNSLGCTSAISTVGAPSATSTNPFSIVAQNVIPGEAGFVIYGFKKANLAFHGGRICVKAPFERWLPPKAANASGPPPCAGVLSRNFNNRIQSGADAQLTAGQTVFAQWYVRDPADPGGNLENLTDAVRFVICP